MKKPAKDLMEQIALAQGAAGWHSPTERSRQ